jgi:hypothetical protein
MKNLLVKLCWLAICVGIMIPMHLGLKDKAYTFAEERATIKYVPISEEEVYRRAGVLCVRPLGEEDGCQDEVTDAKANDALEAYQQTQKEKLRSLRLYLARSGHKQEYDKEHVFPLMNTLQHGLDIGFGILYSAIALYVMLFMCKWFSSRGRLAIGRGMEKIGNAAVPEGVKDFASNRKLRQVQEDFNTLKKLHENGLITEEMFLKRKREMQFALEKNDVFN